MRKARDYIRLFEGYELADRDVGAIRRGVCRVRIYEQARDRVGEEGEQQCSDWQYRDWQCPAPVALISELPDNPNVEVSEIIEVLAAELCAAHALPTATTTFVMHYERSGAELARSIPETFALVEFSDRRLDIVTVEGQVRLSFGEPRLTHVREDELCELTGCFVAGGVQPVSYKGLSEEEVYGDEL